MPAFSGTLSGNTTQLTFSASWDGTGTAPAGSNLPVPCSNSGAAWIQVTGSFTATLAFEGSVDGSTWFALTGYPPGSDTGATGATASGSWVISTAGLSQIRARCTAYTSGSPVVTIGVSQASPAAIDPPAAFSNPVPVLPPNIQSSGEFGVIRLFDMTTRQAGATQKALLFPTTVACTLPTKGGGTAANITNSGNVCGGAFSPDPRWDSVLLDFACVGENAADTITLEIGRVKASGGIAEVLASVVLTASSITLAASVDPFTGAAHSAVTWKFYDVTTITWNGNGNAIGEILQEIGGTSGNLSQLRLSCHDVAYYYIVITAFSDGGVRTTEFVCDMTPTS